MSLAGVVAVTVAVSLETTLAELPTRLHPVAWFGKLVAPFDREWGHPTAVGLLAAGTLPAAAGVAVWGLLRLAARVDPLAAGVAAGVVLFVTTSLRRLLSAARTVIEASDADTAAARDRLPALAGRDPEPLSPGELRSAAVESAAENLSDGLLAPLCAFGLGAVVSLPVAAGLAAWVKGVNTMDSMLGYHSKPAGTASARLDDLVMALPARASAGLLAATAGRPRVLGAASRAARQPSSPNAGWPMATVAAVAGVTLQKPGAYRLSFGPRLPSVGTARRCVRLVRRAGIAAYAGVGVVVGVVA